MARLEHCLRSVSTAICHREGSDVEISRSSTSQPSERVSMALKFQQSKVQCHESGTCKLETVCYARHNSRTHFVRRVTLETERRVVYSEIQLLHAFLIWASLAV